MKKLKQINFCSLPDIVTFLVRFPPTALIQFKPIKVLALSSPHTAGLVQSDWEKHKLAEFQHIFTGANGIFQSGAWNILKLQFLRRRIQEVLW